MTIRPSDEREDDRRNLDAGEYVLGTMPESERRGFESRLAIDADLGRAVAAWRRRLAPIAEPLAPVTPPAALWDRIASTVEASGAFATIRADEGAWHPVVPGIERKLLHVDSARGFNSFLLRFAPGSVLPAHDHADDEECMMIEGEVIIAGTRLAAGDFQLAPKGRRHPEISSPTGGLVYIRAPIRRATA